MRHALLVLALVTAAAVTQTTAQSPRTVPAGMVRRASAAIIPPMVEKLPVFVDHTGTDAAGRVFVSGLKGAIRASQRYALAEFDRDAKVVVVVVSVSPAPNTRMASAISLAYVANNEWRSLLGSAARFAGRDRAEAMGRDTLAELSAVLAAYELPTGQ